MGEAGVLRGAESPKHKPLCSPCRGGPEWLGRSLCPLPRSVSVHAWRPSPASCGPWAEKLGQRGALGPARLRPPLPRPARPFLLGSSPATSMGWGFPRQAWLGSPQEPAWPDHGPPPAGPPSGASSLLPTRWAAQGQMGLAETPGLWRRGRLGKGPAGLSPPSDSQRLGPSVPHAGSRLTSDP